MFKDPEAYKEYQKKYQAENREKLNAKAREYVRKRKELLKNNESIPEKTQSIWATDKNAYYREYFNKNKEVHKETKKRYYEKLKNKNNIEMV